MTVLIMGPAGAEDTMRKTLAMGADRGVLVTDPALAGSDWLATAKVLAATLRTLSFDLVLTGMESTDARSGVVAVGIAELLSLPCLTNAAKLEVDGETVRIDRQIPGGYQGVTAPGPCVVSVVKGVNEPRYPSLKGIMAAKRKDIQKLTTVDLAVATSSVGYEGAKSRVVAVEPRAEKARGEVIQGDTAEVAASRIADFLQEKKLI
ncbi:MAG: electron transfer flavoprotein subunit beta [Chloroflexi bacterium]|nr:MAG: electron transfer flavoprotein subunit beta [Chloroflexota bacterium]